MKPFAKIILLLLIPLSLVVAYALSSIEIGEGDYTLEKADLSGIEKLVPQLFASRDIADDIKPDTVAVDTVQVVPDTLVSIAFNDSLLRVTQADSLKPQSQKQIKVAAPDSTKFRIMIFGDSMLEKMSRSLCDYAMENGYDLSSVMWYSSSTKLWAETDTLQYFLDRIQPDYILLCLGSNELFVRDLNKREKYIATIVSKISHRPFVWISPPNWKPDTGLNDLIITQVGAGRYFDSRHLELERISDRVHPTAEAAAIWVDTIASWISSPQARNPLPMNRPTEERRRKYHQYVLQPVN